MNTMRYFSPKNRKGYSLLELLIAISLFVIISLIVMNNFRQGQKMDDLRTAAVELVSNFREVQILGMSGQVINICHEGGNDLLPCTTDTDCPDGECGLVPIGGFGTTIKPVAEGVNGITACHDVAATKGCPTDYTLFADIAGSTLGEFEPSEDMPLEGKNKYPFPNNVRIRDYFVECSWVDSPGIHDCPSTRENGVDVSFRPPKPTPYTFASGSKAYSEQSVYLLLEHTDTEKCRMVTINGVSGEIDETPDANCMIFDP